MTRLSVETPVFQSSWTLPVDNHLYWGYTISMKKAGMENLAPSLRCYFLLS